MFFRRLCLGVLVCLAGMAKGQERMITLSAPPEIVESGVFKHLLPRFKLKHRITVELRPAGEAGVDAAMAADIAALESAPGFAGAVPVMIAANEAAGDSPPLSLVLFDGPRLEMATRFRDWLTSEVGSNTIKSYQLAGAQVFVPYSELDRAPEPVVITGDIHAGEKLALYHCGRCHVVNAKNRMGGIGSTPSFGALRNIPDWQDRFLAFWSLNPHPSFTQVDGVTEPFDPDRPPHIAPVELTLDDLDAITAYAASIPPKDLGAGVEAR